MSDTYTPPRATGPHPPAADRPARGARPSAAARRAPDRVRWERPNVPLTAAQLHMVQRAADQARTPLGVWLERAALAVIGATGVPGVRGGPPAFAAERSAWLAGVQAMREAALDITFLAGGPGPRPDPATRVGAVGALLGCCEAGLADANRRAAESAPAAGARARATGLLPAADAGHLQLTQRRIRVGFTEQEAVLLVPAAQVCGTTVGRFVAAAATGYAQALDTAQMAAVHTRLTAAAVALQGERAYWSGIADACLTGTGQVPAGWSGQPAPPHLQAALADLRDTLAQARAHWSWMRPRRPVTGGNR